MATPRDLDTIEEFKDRLKGWIGPPPRGALEMGFWLENNATDLLRILNENDLVAKRDAQFGG